MGPWPPKFLAYFVILCFEKRCPKQSSLARLKLKYLPQKKFWAGYAIGENIGQNVL